MDLTGTYMEILCGLQQFISMFELYQMIQSATLLVNIKLNESRRSTMMTIGAGRISLAQSLVNRQETIKKHSNRARYFLYIITVLTAIGIVFALFYILEYNIQSQELTYGIITLTLFGITGILCSIILIMLFVIITKNFKNNLNKEKQQLLICQSIFVFSFMVRVCLIAVVQSTNWVDFTQDYPCQMNHTIYLPLQFLVYNFLPYITLMYMHWWNFRE